MRLRLAFVLGVLGLMLFEAANVYFVMPFPGSQRFDTLDLAYALYQWRWRIRAGFAALMLAGLWDAWRAGWRWRAGVALGAVAVGGVALCGQLRPWRPTTCSCSRRRSSSSGGGEQSAGGAARRSGSRWTARRARIR
jgi:uncharacterized membrane protein YgcG